MSSPGTYSRCSANSTEKPRNGLRWSPEMNPSTISRALKSRPSILSRTLGSRYRVLSVVTRALAGRGDGLEEVVDEAVARHPFGLGAVGRDDAVAQDGVRDRAHVLGRHVEPSLEQRARLGAEHEVLARARAGAPGRALLDEGGGFGLAHARRAHEAQDVLEDVLRHRDAPHDLLELEDLGAGEH